MAVISEGVRGAKKGSGDYIFFEHKKNEPASPFATALNLETI